MSMTGTEFHDRASPLLAGTQTAAPARATFVESDDGDVRGSTVNSVFGFSVAYGALGRSDITTNVLMGGGGPSRGSTKRRRIAREQERRLEELLFEYVRSNRPGCAVVLLGIFDGVLDAVPWEAAHALMQIQKAWMGAQPPDVLTNDALLALAPAAFTPPQQSSMRLAVDQALRGREQQLLQQAAAEAASNGVLPALHAVASPMPPPLRLGTASGGFGNMTGMMLPTGTSPAGGPGPFRPPLRGASGTPTTMRTRPARLAPLA
jgi:hypothetical protein